MSEPWIFCFPYAGGNPRMFDDWRRPLAGAAELVAMPVRGASIDEVIEAATATIGSAMADDPRPVYLFGHSLGALVAFEVARRLDAQPALRHLVASGLAAPSLLPSERVRELVRLDGREFAEALGFFGGLPPEVIADEDVLELLLPGMLADFRLAAGYRYRPAEPLAVDVSLINGRDDPHVGPAQLKAWSRECRRPAVRHWADGGHFYFDKDPTVVIEILGALVGAENHVELI
ncbi:MAG: thioesterase II family protein [Labedaea sp.]